ERSSVVQIPQVALESRCRHGKSAEHGAGPDTSSAILARWPRCARAIAVAPGLERTWKGGWLRGSRLCRGLSTTTAPERASAHKTRLNRQPNPTVLEV